MNLNVLYALQIAYAKGLFKEKPTQNAWLTESSEGLPKSTVEASANATSKSHSQRPHLQAYSKFPLVQC